MQEGLPQTTSTKEFLESIQSGGGAMSPGEERVLDSLNRQVSEQRAYSL